MISGGPNKTRAGQIFVAGLMAFCLMLGCWATGVQGAAAVTITPEKQMGLADHFFQKESYDQAIVEYRKFLYLFGDHQQAGRAAFQIALAHFKQHQYDKALKAFKKISAKPDQAFSVPARFMVSRCLAALGRRLPAVANLKGLLDTAENKGLRDRACYHIGWVYLETVREIDGKTLSRAADYFSRISPANQEAYQVQQLQEDLKAARNAPQGLLASRKHPSLAGGLAVFPGLGHVYCGRYHDALISFLINGGLIWAAWEAFDSDLEVLGSMISFAEVGFYGGNIYGAVSAAHKYNRRRSRAFLDNLKDIRIGVAPVDNGRGIMAAVKVAF